MRIFIATLTLSLLMGSMSLNASAKTDNWPNWRGPNTNLVAPAGEYPTALDPATNAAWKVELPGKGSSTPCVWGNHIFVTCNIEGDDGIVCYNLEGKELWRKKLGKERPPIRNTHKNGGGSNPTPVTDGKRVFVYYRSGTLAALNFQGKVLWTQNLHDQFAPNTLWWDLGTSPVLAGENVVVAVMHTGESYLVAINQKSGKVAWRTSRNYKNEMESDQAYTTPIVTKVDGKPQIVTWGADHLTGHSLDGELIWTCGGLNPDNKPMWRAVASHNITNGHAVVPYGRGDFIAFIKLGGQGDVTATAHVGNVVKRAIGADVPTPIAEDGKAYVLTDKGKVMCYDITNGEELWDRHFQLPRGAPKYYSSPVKAGDLFYFAREDGVIHVTRKIEGGMELISTNEMPERQIAGVIPINNHILLRSEKSLYYFK